MDTTIKDIETKTFRSSHIITYISVILFFILCLWISSVPVISSPLVIIFLLVLLQFYSIFVIYNYNKPGNIQKIEEKVSDDIKEPFLFEVSPEKQQCMEERVSTKHQSEDRSKTCCKGSETGGKLPFIEDWKKEGWLGRTDNWVDSPLYNSYQTQLPPTSLV